MISPYWNIVTILLSLVGSSMYIRSMLQGKTAPNKMGWFIWTLAPLAASFIILQNGGGWSAIPVFMSWIIPVFIFSLSFFIKKAYWKVSRLDIVCLISALIALYFWLIAKDIVSATLFSIIADAFGFVPTIVKAWNAPETENPYPYIAGWLNASIGLLTLTNYAFYLYGMPMYLLLGNSILLFVIFRKKIFK